MLKTLLCSSQYFRIFFAGMFYAGRSYHLAAKGSRYLQRAMQVLVTGMIFFIPAFSYRLEPVLFGTDKKNKLSAARQQIPLGCATAQVSTSFIVSTGCTCCSMFLDKNKAVC